jgi:hypothetical protein
VQSAFAALSGVFGARIAPAPIEAWRQPELEDLPAGAAVMLLLLVAVLVILSI